jgi:hypothetical protein
MSGVIFIKKKEKKKSGVILLSHMILVLLYSTLNSCKYYFFNELSVHYLEEDEPPKITSVHISLVRHRLKVTVNQSNQHPHIY